MKVATRKTLHSREGCPEVGRELPDHLGSPAFPALTFENLPTDVVVEADLLGIGRE
jgi:hypothetical protein